MKHFIKILAIMHGSFAMRARKKEHARAESAGMPTSPRNVWA